MIMTHEVNAVAAIAARDLQKFLRDGARIVGSFILPFLLIILMGGTAQLNLGGSVGFNFTAFTFTGVLGMTVFQSSAQGIASLLDDRQNDFAQEIFVSPVSRYTIIFGKLLGETLVALTQLAPLVALGILLHVSLTPTQLALLIPVALASCLVGASFGLLAMAAINTQQAANQVFNFLLLPQFFLAGVFTPIAVLPWYLAILSRLSPMRYIVDLFRNVMYAGNPDYHRVVLLDPLTNTLTLAAMFAVFMVIGTALFVRRETNR
ncbi:MAG TPA: ABC transporter permease [Ktedonobacterales bacterium]|nr:ABC transporter permease [Ktedonobacterales bacterium]